MSCAHLGGEDVEDSQEQFGSPSKRKHKTTDADRTGTANRCPKGTRQRMPDEEEKEDARAPERDCGV